MCHDTSSRFRESLPDGRIGQLSPTKQSVPFNIIFEKPILGTLIDAAAMIAAENEIEFHLTTYAKMDFLPTNCSQPRFGARDLHAL